MDRLKMVWRYLKYWLRAQSRYSVKSPFVYRLLTEVIHTDKNFYAFEEIDGIRQMLEKQEGSIQVTDFGAGSQLNNKKERKISSIAKNAAKSRKLGELLFRLVAEVKPKYGLELGTSLGISCLYQYSAARTANWVTMEGCPETAKLAKKVFTTYKADTVEVVVGDFKSTLPSTLSKFPKLDYAFFDGNHQKAATIDYFLQAVPKAEENSLFIFDDIHWSEGMEEAWEEIKKHPKVALTIDLFWIGLVFFRSDQDQKHFVLK